MARKSGMPPAMPVSMTATPTPLPVTSAIGLFHTCGASTDAG